MKTGQAPTNKANFGPVILAIVVCGTLDIVWAVASTMIRHGNVAGMLRGIASGPFGDVARDWGVAGSILGLIVHFVIMAAMVIVFFVFVWRGSLQRLPWWSLGLSYGLVRYASRAAFVSTSLGTASNGWEFVLKLPSSETG